MDQSEIYLELNMRDEAAEMAREAVVRFQDLHMNYEAARSLVNLAIAIGHPGNAARSLETFSQAREIFAREKNPVWPSLIDLYQAMVLYDSGREQEAWPICANALEFFRSCKMGSKEILCHLLLGRIALRGADVVTARLHSDAALRRLDVVEAPTCCIRLTSSSRRSRSRPETFGRRRHGTNRHVPQRNRCAISCAMKS